MCFICYLYARTMQDSRPTFFVFDIRTVLCVGLGVSIVQPQSIAPLRQAYSIILTTFLPSCQTFKL